ncbi:MAG: SDR family oxidoreductase, partial [Chloroflexi bacterium]|nr:SDR family oxidoreductase [Chloroflexota bacterium]
MDLELTGKVAIVTGASRGIGKAVARELALEGADVAAVARGREALEATAAEIAGESGRRVLALTADTSDDASVQAMVRAAHEAFGRVDILVNNAASPGSALPPAPLDELTDDHVRADIEVKVLGYLRTARAVAPIMREQ